jgi:hypothetical protein
MGRAVGGGSFRSRCFHEMCRNERTRASSQYSAVFHDRLSDTFRYVASAFFGQIDRNDIQRPLVLPGDQIADDCVAVCLAWISFDKGRPLFAEVTQDKMKIVVE